MKPIISLRLNLWIPSLFAVVFFGLWAIIIWHHYGEEQESFIQNSKYFLTYDLSLIKQELDEHNKPENIDERQHALSMRATNTFYKTLVATDATGTIQNSLKRGVISKNIYHEFERVQADIIQQVQRTQVATIQFDSERLLLTAYYPLLLPRASDEIRSRQEGILYAEYSLLDEQRKLWDEIIHAAVIMACYLVLALIVLISFMYFFVNRPIQRLSKVAQTIADEKIETHFEVKGKGDLASLALTFQKMAETLAHRFTELQQSETALKNQQNLLEKMVEQRTQALTRANTELKEKEKHLAEAQHITHLGSWSFNEKLHYVSWTEEMYHIMEMDPDKDKISQMIFIKRIHPDDRQLIIDTYRNSLQNEAAFEIEYRIVMRDGRIKYVSTQGLTRWDEINGQSALVTQGTLLDITTRKLNELELIKSKEEAVSADIEKSRFLANMSHELRTPMHGILSFARLGIDKLESVDKAKLQMYFEHIYTSGQRLLLLLNDLLDLSKLDAENVQLELSYTDLVALFETCRLEQLARLEELNISVNVIKPDSPMMGNFDSARIGQVITNLLSNAIKFSPSGATITVAIETNKKQELCFTISDEGVGIPLGELDMIFDAFIQSSKTRSEAGGTGLGLAIVLRIIEAHGGKVWAENNPQGGAIFKFVIPRR